MNEGVIEKLGGRKFLVVLVAMLIGTAAELATQSGISASFAGLLVGLVSAFGAANAYVTTKTAAFEPLEEETRAEGPSLNELASHVEGATRNIIQLSEEQQKHAAVISQMGDNLIQTNKRLSALLTLKQGS